MRIMKLSKVDNYLHLIDSIVINLCPEESKKKKIIMNIQRRKNIET